MSARGPSLTSMTSPCELQKGCTPIDFRVSTWGTTFIGCGRASRLSLWGQHGQNISVNNVVAIAVHFTLQHHGSSRTHTRMLFQDYSSAFSTIWPGKLTVKLTDLGTPPAASHHQVEMEVERADSLKFWAGLRTLWLQWKVPRSNCISFSCSGKLDWAITCHRGVLGLSTHNRPGPCQDIFDDAGPSGALTYGGVA